MPPTTHIIGAGLAGLSAAVELAAQGRKVIVYEASGQAGGRCRSYFDATFGATIDNGNHLLLSGNKAAFAYLARIGSQHLFNRVQEAVFDFVDAKTTRRWALHLNDGILPWWLIDKTRRVPGTSFTDYLSILSLLWAQSKKTIAQMVNENTRVFTHLWHPLLLSALNTHPREASAQLAGSILSGTLLKGGKACIPLVADGLSVTFIDPALQYLTAHNAPVLFNHRLKQFQFADEQATALEFTDRTIPLAAGDTIICAVPAWNITALLPEVQAPTETRAILNAHFRIAPPPSFPILMGVIDATTEWIFSFPDRISITVSDADRFMQEDREMLAAKLWQEVAAITGLPAALPPWQIVKEKRATFAATPEQDAKRPNSITKWKNITLAGDWVQTGLPATIEGAIYSGARAADIVMKIHHEPNSKQS